MCIRVSPLYIEDAEILIYISKNEYDELQKQNKK